MTRLCLLRLMWHIKSIARGLWVLIVYYLNPPVLKLVILASMSTVFLH